MVEARSEATEDGGNQYADDAKGLSIHDAFDKTVGAVKSFAELANGASALTVNKLDQMTKFSISDGTACYPTVSDLVASHAGSVTGQNLWKDRDDAAMLRGGTLAAAAAVSEVLRKAGVEGVDTPSVSKLVDQLRQQRWHEVPMNEMRAGDVIVGLLPGMQGGDVGIVGDNNKIFASASDRAGVWTEYPANGIRFSPENKRWQNGAELMVLRAPESANNYPQTRPQPNEVPTAHGR